VSQYQQALESLGVRAGTRVGVLSKNRPEVLFMIGAIGLIGACRVSLHPMGSVDDFEYIMNDAHVEVLVIDTDNFQQAAVALQDRVPHLRHVLSLGKGDVGTEAATLAATFEPRSLVARRSWSAEDLTAISYSGGTTGKPKAITATARTSSALLTIMVTEWEWPAVNRHLICAPLSHGGGTMFMPTLLLGGSMVVVPGFDVEKALSIIERHRITSLWLVPSMIYAMLDHPRLGEYDLSSLEIIYYGAAAISPSRLKEAIERIGPVFFQFYGQTEAPMTITIMRRCEHDPDDLNRLASCGRPVMGVRCTLLDDEGREAPDGQPGEICVQGPLLMGGYLNKPEETAKALEGGWLHTGDIAIRDPGGFLRIVDRKKDMIVTGGFNVFPREVEDVLTTHPAVAEAAVFGVPDEKWGEMIKAAIVLREGATVSDEELRALVRAKKGPVQSPKVVHFLDAIPLSGLGKPDKKALRSQFA
jgi:fatty-acyl-CoA synthase